MPVRVAGWSYLSGGGRGADFCVCGLSTVISLLSVPLCNGTLSPADVVAIVTSPAKRLDARDERAQ